VPHDDGWDPATGPAVKAVDIAATDPTGFDLDKNLALSRFRIGHVLDGKLAIGF